MATVTTSTQLQLINKLANLGTPSPTDLLLIQKALKSYKLSYADLVNSLSDDASLSSNGSELSIANNGVTTNNITNSNVTLPKIQNISNNTILGNVSGGSSNPSEITLDTDLSTVSANHDELISSKAVKDYVDNNVNRNIAIIQETQPNGTFPDGTTSIRFNWQTDYDSNNYSENIPVDEGSSNLQFFQRNLNELKVNQNNIVSNLTNKSFTLENGTFRINGWVACTDVNGSYVIRLKNHAVNTSYGLVYFSMPIQKDSDDRVSSLLYIDCVIVVDSVDVNARTFSIETGHFEYNRNYDVGAPIQPLSEEVYSNIVIEKLL